MLSVETEDAFHQALPLGLPIEVSPEIADGIVLMVEDVGTVEEIIAARGRSFCVQANDKRPDRRVLGEMAAMRFISASPSQSPTLKKIVMAFVQGCVKCTLKELPAGAKVPLRPTLLVPLHLPDMVQDLLNTLAVSP